MKCELTDVDHQRHCEELRRKLIDACNSVSVSPPPPLAPLPAHYHAAPVEI